MNEKTFSNSNSSRVNSRSSVNSQNEHSISQEVNDTVEVGKNIGFNMTGKEFEDRRVISQSGDNIKSY